MADPLTIAFVSFAAISAVSSVVGGIAGNQAAKDEARLLDEQGQLAQSEAQAEAQRKANENRKFLKRQKLAFLKSGVTLEGSPLFTLETTLEEGQEEVTAIAKRGGAQARLFSQKASQARGAGRSALVSGIGGATSTAFNAFGTGRVAGLF